MKQKIKLPELKNHVSSDFCTESCTAVVGLAKVVVIIIIDHSFLKEE